jgi:Leucine-rich repeat (LRR) protein
MWNPRAESKTDYNESAKFLSTLTSLRKLTLSLSFLTSIRFDDSALEKLQPLGPTLEELVLRRAKIKGQGLRHFTNLRALDITWAYVEDEGLASLAGMTKLRKLWARDTRLTNKTLAVIGKLRELEQLDIGGAEITEAGLAHLAGLTRMKKLDILGANVTDSGLDHLMAMSALESLNLYRTKVSNAGLEKLKAFRKLQKVDLRYTRSTRAGVANLRASLPKAEFLFADSSVQQASAKSEPKDLTRESDGVVAAWVKSLGGKTRIENGALVEVNLSGSAATDDDLKNLSGRSTIRKLVLDGTEIGDLGMQQVGSLSGLEELSVRGTGVSDAGLRPIAKLAALKRLSLSNCASRKIHRRPCEG